MKKTKNERLVCNDILIQRFYGLPSGQQPPPEMPPYYNGLFILKGPHGEYVSRCEYVLNDFSKSGPSPYRKMMNKLKEVVKKAKTLDKAKNMQVKEKLRQKLSKEFNNFRQEHSGFYSEMVCDIPDNRLNNARSRYVPFFNITKLRDTVDRRKFIEFINMIDKIYQNAQQQYDNTEQKAAIAKVRELVQRMARKGMTPCETEKELERQKIDIPYGTLLKYRGELKKIKR